MMAARVTPEPSCTTVWTGMTIVGGIATAMIASRMRPPAVPVNTPMNEVAKEAAVSPANARAAKSMGRMAIGSEGS